MQRRFLLIPLLIFSSYYLLHAAKQEVQVRLVTRSFDSIDVMMKCRADYLRHPVHLLECSILHVKKYGASSYEKISTDTIRYLSIKGKTYVQMEAEVFGHKLFLEEDTGTVFLYSAFEHQFWPPGNFDLVKRKYQYLIQKDHQVFFACRDLSITLFKSLNRPYVYGNARFTELCKILFWDDPDLLVKIVDGEEGYHFADFPAIVKAYNVHQH